MEPNTHDWNLFIPPDRLEALLTQNGLTPKGREGIAPGLPPLKLLWTLNQRVLGRLSLAEAGKRIRLGLSPDQEVMYIGHAVKGQG